MQSTDRWCRGLDSVGSRASSLGQIFLAQDPVRRHLFVWRHLREEVARVASGQGDDSDDNHPKRLVSVPVYLSKNFQD